MKKTFLLTLMVFIVFTGLKAQHSTAWYTTGNSLPSMTTETYFLGSTNNYPLRLRTNNQDRMFINGSNGNIGIGTNNPQAKLAVNGEILAKSVRVNTNANYWPDYVFGDNYNLMSLMDLERYVSTYKHLPGVPSAQEVDNQGDVDLGAMNAILLEKVEELTRYIIDLQKQIDELKNGKE